MTDLKMYVWEGVLTDYTDGMMVALAHSVEEARQLLKEEDKWLPDEDLNSEPEVVTTPKAFCVWGGG